MFGFVRIQRSPPIGQYVCNQEIKQFISKLSANGRGDGPEAVLDGLNDSINKTQWRKDSLRYIIHIADAPPHGKEYVSGNDGFPEGCPCGIKIEKLAELLKLKNIKYKLMKIDIYPYTMAKIFKSHIKDYEELDLDKPIQLETIVPEILIRGLESEIIDLPNPK